jgi:two-component system, sensor histidine kinase and response regulator
MNGRKIDESRLPQDDRTAGQCLPGRPIGPIEVADDATRCDQAEESLRASEKQYRSLFENMLNGCAYCEMLCDDQERPIDFVYLAVNSAFERLTGLKDVVGKRVTTVIPGIKEASPELFETYGRVALTGKPERFEFDFKSMASWLSVSVYSIQKGFFVAAFDNITDRKRAEAELRAATRAAQAANRAKSEFLANMSHEIRTPMTAIIGFSDLLATPNLSHDEQCEFLEGIRTNGAALLELIGDILDLSRIEADKLTLDVIDCPLSQIINDLLAVVQVRATEKQLNLKVDCEYPLPERIHTDPLRLRQILVNLVGNAVKFTDHGEVRITIRCLPRTNETMRMQFAVSDTGIGIPADKIGEIFQPFTQADTSASRRYGGTGLGLAISHRLAKALEGDIQVSSEPGKGSTFTLTVDCGRFLRGS